MTAKSKNSLFKELLNKKVKIKFSDEGSIRSIAGTIKDVNNFYILLEREFGDPFFINHSVISRIIPVNSFDADDDHRNDEGNVRIKYRSK